MPLIAIFTFITQATPQKNIHQVLKNTDFSVPNIASHSCVGKTWLS